MIGEVVNTETKGPPMIPEVHTPLDVHIQFEIIRKAKGVWLPGNVTCLILN
jgi:hypothetical protein